MTVAVILYFVQKYSDSESFEHYKWLSYNMGQHTKIFTVSDQRHDNLKKEERKKKNKYRHKRKIRNLYLSS
jgi:hypothetical protein